MIPFYCAINIKNLTHPLKNDLQFCFGPERINFAVGVKSIKFLINDRNSKGYFGQENCSSHSADTDGVLKHKLHLQTPYAYVAHCKIYMDAAVVQLLHRDTHTNTHRCLMVSFDTRMSYFKGLSSERSRLWYLKQLHRVLQCCTHTLTYTVLHLSKNTLIGPSAEPLRGKVKKKKKETYRKEWSMGERRYSPLRIYLMAHLLFSFLSIVFLVMLMLLPHM